MPGPPRSALFPYTTLFRSSFFVKASIAALRAFPRINAEIQGNEIVYKGYYDIGIAVGAEGGLVVPVIRDADQPTFAQIDRKSTRLNSSHSQISYAVFCLTK